MRRTALAALTLATVAALAAPFEFVDPNAGCDVAVNPTCDSEYEAPRIVTAIGDQSSTVGVADSLDPSSSIYCGGAVANPVWSATLPAGLSITPSTGAISGTPVSAGAVAASITCTNDLDTVTANLTWTVSGATATVPTWTASPIAGQYTMTVGQETVVDLATLGANIEDIIVTRSTEALADGGPVPDWCSLTGTTLTCTPTATGVTVLHVRATNGTYDAAAAWSARTAGAVATEDFSGATSVSAVASEIGGVAADSVRDATVGLTGGVSMRQRTPGGAEQADVSGHDTRWLIPTTAAADDVFPACLATECDDAYGYTPGQTMCLTYSVLLDRASVRYAGWQPTETPKLTIVDQMPGWPGQATANNWELVTTLLDGHIAGYTGKQATQYADQWQDGIATACNGSDFRLHEIDLGADPLNGTDPGLATGAGAGSAWDACQQDRARYGRLYSYPNQEAYGDGDPVDPLSLSPGAMPEGTDWTHVQQCVVVGTPGQTEQEYRAWVAPHGQDWTLVETRIGYDPGDWTGTQASVYEAAWFVTLAFGAPVDATRPEVRRWIDDVIVSTSQTAAPCFSGECTLRSADAVITINVQEAGAPSWYTSAPDDTWIEVPSSNTFLDIDPRNEPGQSGWTFGGNGGSQHTAIIDAWNTAFAHGGNYWCTVDQGGHFGTSQNGGYCFGPFTASTPSWTRPIDPSHSLDWSDTGPNWDQTDGYYSDGAPVSRHGYTAQLYDTARRRAVQLQGDAIFGSGNAGTARPNVVAFGDDTLSSVTRVDVEAGGENWPDVTAKDNNALGVSVSYDPDRDAYYLIKVGSARNLYVLDPSDLAGGWSSGLVSGGYSATAVAGLYNPSIVHPGLEVLVFVYGNGADTLTVTDIDHDGDQSGTFGNYEFWRVTDSNYTLNGLDDAALGVVYDPVAGEIVGYNGGSGIYRLVPSGPVRDGAGELDATITWSWQQITVQSGGDTPTAKGSNGTFARFQYIADVDAFCAFNSANDSNVYCFKRARP